jgi:glycerophosphoryl diester phosphodiesterase
LVNVELKGDVANGAWMCEQAARELLAHGGSGIVLSSFSPLMILRLTKLLPEIPTALLFDKSQTITQRLLPLGPLGAVGAHPEDDCVTPTLVARIREKSAFVGVWTVNDVERAHVLAKMGVEILISDDPGPLVASFT